MASLPLLPSPPSLSIGLVQGALVGGVLGGIAATSGTSRVWSALSKSRRRGLFVTRRPPKSHRCPFCAGFKITACDLCQARGVCDYRKRYARLIPCPRCMLRRFVTCGACSGSGRRFPVGADGGSGALARTGTACEGAVAAARRFWRRAKMEGDGRRVRTSLVAVVGAPVGVGFVARMLWGRPVHAVRGNRRQDARDSFLGIMLGMYGRMRQVMLRATAIARRNSSPRLHKI